MLIRKAMACKIKFDGQLFVSFLFSYPQHPYDNAFLHNSFENISGNNDFWMFDHFSSDFSDLKKTFYYQVFLSRLPEHILNKSKCKTISKNLGAHEKINNGKFVSWISMPCTSFRPSSIPC